MSVIVIMQNKKQYRNIFPSNINYVFIASEGEMVIKPFRLFAVSCR